MQARADDPAEAGTRFCDACGKPNRAAARFCAHCGADIATAHGDGTPLDLARRLSARGEQVRARTILEDALAREVSNGALRLSYATMLLQSGEWTSGLDHLRQLSPECARTPVVQAYIGGALLGLNRVSEAKDVLDTAFAQWPRDFYVLLKRGELYCRLGIYLTALEALERAAGMECGDPVTRDAVRRLLRFARDKNRSGFVRYLPPRTATSWFKLRLPFSNRHANTVWGT